MVRATRSTLSRLRPSSVGPVIEDAFTSPLHDERLATVLGITLGVTFTTCFATGLISHGLQHPPSWFRWPARPVNLYRVTQGLHVASGIVSIPLLLAKLWVVYPRFWTWPPLRDVTHAVERISLIPLVGGALFQLFTGTVNIAYWYRPMPFFFTVAHFWVAWITIGALLIHIAAKLTTARSALANHPMAAESPGQGREDHGLSRRGFMGAVAATGGVLALTMTGDTIAPLDRLAVLAPRRVRHGPQHLPVNRSATEADVVARAQDPGYRLVVEGRVSNPYTLTLRELRAMPQHSAGLPITCVEGWSTAARWRGVPVRDLLARAGVGPHARVRVQSLETNGTYAHSILDALHTEDRDTMLALELNGEPLDLDHGFPCRLITPNRAGVLQTKWVSRLVVQ
ncbi:MAG: molybdopterin-dependent oxidoreductase [Acidimicrobiales bacterium]